MNINYIDYFLFGGFLLVVLSIVIRNLLTKQSTTNYFRTGGLNHWFYIGCTVIASNITLVYIIACASVGYNKSIAFGSYEWTAGVAIIFVSLYILPKFMALGVLTLPEYLEMRYTPHLRLLVSMVLIAAPVISGLATSFYSSALLIQEIFVLGDDYLYILIWGSGIITSMIILSGGLSAMIKTNMLIVLMLLAGGIMMVVFCLIEVGGIDKFLAGANGRMEIILPADDPKLPWTQVFLGSLWILHIYFWGFNQTIQQTVLASSSLSHAQKGMLFAGSVKLIFPFLFFIPGIVGYELLQGHVEDPDKIFAVILREIIPVGFKSFILVAFIGTVIGATNAMANACSTIFTHDIYKRFIHREASESRMILVARISVVCFVSMACLLSPNIKDYKNLFEYSQYVTVGVAPVLAAIYLFGLYVKRTPRIAGICSFLIVVPFYIFLAIYDKDLIEQYGHWLSLRPGDFSTLQLAAINFSLASTILILFTLVHPLKEPINLKGNRNIRFERNLVVVVWGIFLLTLITSIYLIFL